MGRIHVPPLCDLATGLRDLLGIRTFVETGTYQGNATAWAAGQFDEVWTIEVDPGYQAAAKERLREHAHIRYVLGDSGTALARVCDGLDAPAIFWLDAHAGGGHFGNEDVCPLLEELDAVVAHRDDHVILIDDARAFVAPPPPPFDADRWPSLDEVFARLQARAPRHVVLINDCLVCVPPAARALVRGYVLRVRPKI